MVSTCSGICRTSRSERFEVTVTWSLITPSVMEIGRSTVASGCSITTVRAASENPLRVTITRYEPDSGTLKV